MSKHVKAIDHSVHVSGFSCNPVASISVISVLLSGYTCVPLLVHSGLLFKTSCLVKSAMVLINLRLEVYKQSYRRGSPDTVFSYFYT